MEVVFAGKNIEVTLPSLDCKDCEEGCVGALSRSNKNFIFNSIVTAKFLNMWYKKILKPFFFKCQYPSKLFSEKNNAQGAYPCSYFLSIVVGH